MPELYKAHLEVGIAGEVSAGSFPSAANSLRHSSLGRSYLLVLVTNTKQQNFMRQIFAEPARCKEAHSGVTLNPMTAARVVPCNMSEGLA